VKAVKLLNSLARLRLSRLRRLPGAALGLPLIGLCAATVAWRAGGGADARVPPPRLGEPSAAVTGAPRDAGREGAEGAEGYEVKTRLIDALGLARIDVPGLAGSQAAFQGYWRKMAGPWVHPAGTGASLVTTLALRTSTEETQWAVTTHDGGTWAPPARVWNMNEGSYDQREAIFAPPPATLTFRMTLPPRARLRVAPAVASGIDLEDAPRKREGEGARRASGTIRFEVDVVDAAGATHGVFETTVDAGGGHAWRDADVDLSAWAGQPVEVVLRTAADTPVTGGALALWGDPVVVSKGPTRLPYNVLWIVVDALRPDVVARLHDPDDDRAKRSAARPPLEALLPEVPGLMPSIDALAARGVHFAHAWSAAAWTRPGTLAMLTGERSSELGVDTTAWVLPPGEARRYYASDPPLLPLVLRKSGVVTAAFVNNFFMSGYSAVGVDMGFEHLTDHRYRTRDTAEIERDALGWLDAHGGDRFFLFANFNSPHEPYDPTPEMLARIPAAPGGAPLDPQVRAYMAEGAKDDAAIGALLAKIEALGLTKTTLVVVTSDHGETLSSAHDAMGLGHMPMRFHHAVGNYEETTRIPIVMALPGVLDGGRAIADRVRNVDIAPTVLDAEGLEADPRMSGRSMLPLVRGRREAEPRVVISEGRASRAVLWGSWRLVLHDPVARPAAAAPSPLSVPPVAAPTPGAKSDKDPEEARTFEDELYDLATDPGERHNVARQHPDVVAELRARLAAGLANVPAADARPPEPEGPPPTLRVRFAGGGQVHRVVGALTVGDGKHPATVTVDPSGIAREAVRIDGQVVDFALATSREAAVGFDVRIEPPGAPVTWQLYLDDAPWPEGHTFAGPFGLPAVAAKGGIASDEARDELYAATAPTIDPARDLGVFFTRDRPGSGKATSGPGESDTGDDPGAGGPGSAAKKEMQRVLEQWGYAHKPTK
jgi:arylsulfatase A-like enzyme